MPPGEGEFAIDNDAIGHAGNVTLLGEIAVEFLYFRKNGGKFWSIYGWLNWATGNIVNSQTRMAANGHDSTRAGRFAHMR